MCHPTEKKEPLEDLKDKFRSFFRLRDPQKKKDALPPKAHFSISGSEFVEVFVGVGAARVRQPMFLPERFAPSKTYKSIPGENSTRGDP